MNEIGKKTVRNFTSGTPAHRTTGSIPVKYRRIPAIEISMQGTIIFPDTTNLNIRTDYARIISR
jgi:hypothetical protein